MSANRFKNFSRDFIEILLTRAKYPSRIKKDHPKPKLPSDIQELARKAYNGSIEDLRALGTKLESESDAPLSLYPEILDTLSHHVWQPPLSPDAANDKDRVELARASLHGISLAVKWNASCGCFDVDGSMPVSDLLLCWPMLWEWMKYLYYSTEDGLDFSFDADSRPLTASRMQSMIDIQSIVSWAIYKSPPSLYNTVISTPGLIFLVAEIWTRQSDRPRNDSLYREGFLVTIAFLKSVMVGPDLIDFDLLVEAACNGPARLRYVMLKPLQLVAYGGQLWSFSYQWVLDVYSALSRRCPRLCNVLPLVDTMLAICHALGILSKFPRQSLPLPPESINKEPNVNMCVKATCDLIFAFSQTRDDFMWINTAIHNDFIPSILRSGLKTSKDDTVNSINAVFEFIRIHLCYRTILRSLVKVMASASVTTLASKIPRNSKLALVWERFSSAVRVELEAKTVFDKRGLKYAHKCSFVQCHVIEAINVETFKLCGKCHFALYCSKSCQKQDWKSGGHRTVCDIAHRCQQEGKSPPISIRDLTFFSFLMDREMVCDRENIIQQRDSMVLQTTGVSVHPLVLLHDRTLPPLNRFTVSLPNTLDPRTVANYELWKAVAAVSPQKPVPPSVMFTFIRVPFGKHRVLLKLRSREAGPLFGLLQRPTDPHT